MCFAMAHMSACCAIDPTCGRISEGVVFVEPYVIDKCGSLEHLYKVSEDCAKSKCDNDEHCEALRTYHQQIVAGIERMFGGTRWVVRKPINLPSPEVIAGMATASGGQDFRKVSDQVTLPVDLLNALEDAVSSTLGTDYTVKMDKTQTDSNNRDGSSPPGVTYHIVRGQKVCTIGAVLRNKRTGVVD